MDFLFSLGSWGVIETKLIRFGDSFVFGISWVPLRLRYGLDSLADQSQLVKNLQCRRPGFDF